MRVSIGQYIIVSILAIPLKLSSNYSDDQNAILMSDIERALYIVAPFM